MTTERRAGAGRAARAPGLPTLDLVVVPRWLRERRRAERLAARPDAVAAEIAHRVGSLTRPDRSRTVEDLVREQGVMPVRDWSSFGEPIPEGDWESFFAAIMEAKGR